MNGRKLVIKTGVKQADTYIPSAPVSAILIGIDKQNNYT